MPVWLQIAQLAVQLAPTELALVKAIIDAVDAAHQAAPSTPPVPNKTE